MSWSIRLKFIGANGSMGLIHGLKYDVRIDVCFGMWWVYVEDIMCPYQSIQAFANNWSL